MAVLVKTRRLVNPARRRRKTRNPAKMSLKQKLHFGTARQRAAARLSLRNPSRRRKNTGGSYRKLKKRVKSQISYTKPKKTRMKRFAAEKRAIRSNRRRRKNVGEIVSISLAGLNPGRKRSTVARRRRRSGTRVARRRRRNYGTVIGRSFSNTRVGRRKARKNPGTRRRRASAVHHRRRRRSNPLYRLRRVRRHRNPGIAGITTGVVGKAFAVIGGAIGSKYVTQLALGGNNSGYIGYAGNLVASIGLGWLAGKFTKSKEIGTSVMIGGVAALALRMLQDFTSIGQYVNLSLAGAGKGGDLSLGIIEDSSFPVPQNFAPGSMTSAIVPRATRNFVNSSVSAASAQTSQMAIASKGVGRMMGGRQARRAIL